MEIKTPVLIDISRRGHGLNLFPAVFVFISGVVYSSSGTLLGHGRDFSAVPSPSSPHRPAPLGNEQSSETLMPTRRLQAAASDT